jgi:hypothetical protein
MRRVSAGVKVVVGLHPLTCWKSPPNSPSRLLKVLKKFDAVLAYLGGASKNREGPTMLGWAFYIQKTFRPN